MEKSGLLTEAKKKKKKKNGCENIFHRRWVVVRAVYNGAHVVGCVYMLSAFGMFRSQCMLNKIIQCKFSISLNQLQVIVVRINTREYFNVCISFFLCLYVHCFFYFYLLYPFLCFCPSFSFISVVSLSFMFVCSKVSERVNCECEYDSQTGKYLC